jgi:hypothetical protein
MFARPCQLLEIEVFLSCRGCNALSLPMFSRFLCSSISFSNEVEEICYKEKYMDEVNLLTML